MPARARDLVLGLRRARFAGRRFPDSIGRGGMPAAAKREDDLASPAGVRRLSGGYWRADGPSSPALPLQSLGPRRGQAEARRTRATIVPSCTPDLPADRMRRGGPLYGIRMVADHNRDSVVPEAGSAIFRPFLTGSAPADRRLHRLAPGLCRRTIELERLLRAAERR